MAKAKAGQSAKKRQERERERAAHLEAIIEDLPEHPAPVLETSSSTDQHPVATASDPDAAQLTPSANPARADGDARAAQPDPALDGTAQDDAPDIQPGPDRSINAPPIGIAKLLGDVETDTANDPPDSEPAFAPVPQVPQVSTDSHAEGAMSMDASQSSPRGKMTNRYTVWSGTASRPADAPTQELGSQPTEKTSGPANTTTQASGSGTADLIHEDSASSNDHLVAGRTEDRMSSSTGIDLAMSRLQSATGNDNQGSRSDSPTTGDDIGSAEAALDYSGDRAINATGNVETTIGESSKAVEATMDSYTSDQTGVSSLPGSDNAADEPTGVTGQPDDLAGRLGSAGTRVTDALGEIRNDVTDDPDGQTGQGDGPTDRVSGFVQESRVRASETVDQVRSTVSDAGADLKTSAIDAVDQVQDAGSDIAGTVREASQSARDDLAGAASEIGDRAQTAGKDVAAAVEDGLEMAEERLEQAAGHIAESGEAAAEEIKGAVGRAIHEVRDQVAGTAHDLLTIGRHTASEARSIAADTAADIGSGIAEAAGSVAETGRAAAGVVTGHAAKVTHSLTGSASDAASSLTGTVRSGLGESAAGTSEIAANTAGSASPRRSYNRLIISAVTVGTVSGFNRWAIRRLTGADIAILGPATIHPAILGTGLAALIGTLYLTEE